MTVIPRVALAVGLALLLVACGGGSGDEVASEDAGAPAGGGDPATSRPAPESAAEAPASPERESEASAAPLPAGLEGTLPAVGGGQVVGADLAGRPLALWFWAPW